MDDSDANETFRYFRNESVTTSTTLRSEAPPVAASESTALLGGRRGGSGHNINSNNTARQRIVVAKAEEVKGEGGKKKVVAIAAAGVEAGTMPSVSPKTLGGSNPKPVGSPWLSKWLYNMKTFFLFTHYTLIVFFSAIGAVSIMVSEYYNKTTNVSFVDAMFDAVSCVTGTGLSTVNTSLWSDTSTWIRHVLMILGGTVTTSMTAPLLRLITLRKLKRDVLAHPGDSLRRQRWKRRKRRFIMRLTTSASIICFVTILYWLSMQLIAYVILLATTTSKLSPQFLILKVISAFHNCTFQALLNEDTEYVFVIAMAFLTAAGNTLFAPLFRLYLVACKKVYEKVVEPRRQRAKKNALIAAAAAAGGTLKPSGPSGFSIDGSPQSTTLLAPLYGAEQQQGPTLPSLTREDSLIPTLLSNPLWDAEEVKGDSRVLKGFKAILGSDNPLSYHHFLFSTIDSWNLVGSWFIIVLVMAIPFWLQQWRGPDALLGHLTIANKFLVALAQAIVVRFAGITFVDMTRISRGHMLLIIFCMYLPAIPIPSDDRKSRKWNQLVGRGFWRLFSSRFWYLFVCIVIMVFIEEDRLEAQVHHTLWGIIPRVIVEVVSSHATSGITLSVPGAPFSFSGSCTTTSKFLIMLSMLVGRHRGMDLGIDIGLSDLEEKEKIVRELERIDREQERARILGGGGSGGVAAAGECGAPREHRNSASAGGAELGQQPNVLQGSVNQEPEPPQEEGEDEGGQRDVELKATGNVFRPSFHAAAQQRAIQGSPPFATAIDIEYDFDSSASSSCLDDDDDDENSVLFDTSVPHRSGGSGANEEHNDVDDDASSVGSVGSDYQRMVMQPQKRNSKVAGPNPGSVGGTLPISRANSEVFVFQRQPSYAPTTLLPRAASSVLVAPTVLAQRAADTDPNGPPPPPVLLSQQTIVEEMEKRKQKRERMRQLQQLKMPSKQNNENSRQDAHGRRLPRANPHNPTTTGAEEPPKRE